MAKNTRTKKTDKRDAQLGIPSDDKAKQELANLMADPNYRTPSQSEVKAQPETKPASKPQRKGQKPVEHVELEEAHDFDISKLVAAYEAARAEELSQIETIAADLDVLQDRRKDAKLAATAHRDAMRLSPRLKALHEEESRLEREINATITLMPGVKLGRAPQGSPAQVRLLELKKAIGAEHKALGTFVAKEFNFANDDEFYALLNSEQALYDNPKKEG